MKYYCIGIKGSGMSTLAQILCDLGNDVTGYDDYSDYKYTQKGLDERNIKIYYDNDHVVDTDTIVTYSRAFSDDHKEIVRMKNLGLRIKKYNEIIGDLTRQFYTICVSGTHGKTTTSSLIKHVLENSFGCNYFIGAGEGYANKENKYFVLESDEFNRHFLEYTPSETIITNIELEHTECYKDLDDIKKTFLQFADKTLNTIYVYGDSDTIRDMKFAKDVLYYGFEENNDIVAKNVILTDKGSSFDMYVKGEFIASFEVPLFGKHMILNSLIAAYVCFNKGVSVDVIKQSFKNFINAKRRFVIEYVNNRVILDDYAHHPTEISATLNAVRQKFPNKRLVVVFVPNTYSRTRDLCDGFISALSVADKVYLSEILCDRENPLDYPGVSSSMITSKISGAEIIDVDTIDKLDSEDDSVVCFMGCATTSHLINAYKERIKVLNER